MNIAKVDDWMRKLRKQRKQFEKFLACKRLRNRLCASEQPSAIRYTNDSCRLVLWMKDYLRQRRYSYSLCTVQTRDTLNYRYTISYCLVLKRLSVSEINCARRCLGR